MFKVCWCGTGTYYEFCWNLVLYPVVKELVKSIRPYKNIDKVLPKVLQQISLVQFYLGRCISLRDGKVPESSKNEPKQNPGFAKSSQTNPKVKIVRTQTNPIYLVKNRNRTLYTP